MRIRPTHRHGSWPPAAVLLILLMVGLLGGQVIATWDLPDDSYKAGFWDGGDEDTLLSLVWDHSAGTLRDVSSFVALGVSLPAASCFAHSADLPPLSSFDSRAPPLA
jgi:hypothetical protein